VGSLACQSTPLPGYFKNQRFKDRISFDRLTEGERCGWKIKAGDKIKTCQNKGINLEVYPILWISQK
jgi:hypothetical protein